MLGRIYPLAVLLVFADVVMKTSCAEKGSLTFVIDDTPSMKDDINQIKSSAYLFLDDVFKNSSVVGNMVLVTFNHSDAHVKLVAKNRCEFDEGLKEVNAHGEDYPGAQVLSLKALILALEKSNRDSIIYVFTDHKPKDHQDALIVKELCQKKQSQINFVITGNNTQHYQDESRFVYHDIARACSGLAYEVNKNHVSKVLKSLSLIVTGEKITIHEETIPALRTPKLTYIQFEVDQLMEYVLVFVTGINVELYVYTIVTNDTKIVDLDNCKVHLYTWTTLSTTSAVSISVKGGSNISVVVMGRSDFSFKHGFSELKPKSFNDTFLQPIADAIVYLSVNVTDKYPTVKNLSSQLSGMDEKPISELPMKNISKDFYVTEPFVTLTKMFKVAVIAVMQTGQVIKRFGKMPITPLRVPDNQVLKVAIAEGNEMAVEYNSTLKLTCRVTAFPKPKLSWHNTQGKIKPSTISMIKYPYDYVSYLEIPITEEDNYKCSAVNGVGLNTTSINVKVKEVFTVVNTPQRVPVEYGMPGTLKCDIKSTLPMDIRWYNVDDINGWKKEINDSNEYKLSADKTELTIKKMDLNLTGIYICHAYLVNNNSVKQDFKKRVEITGLVEPKVETQANVTAINGTTAVLECNVSGVPMPSIEWQFGGNSVSSITVRSLAGTRNVLRIKNTKRNVAGLYKCVAENVLAKRENVTTLIIHARPEIVTESKSVEAIEDDLAIKIPCDVTGVPEPVITWKLNENIIKPNETYSFNNGSLVIQNPSYADIGKYTCEAKNYLGSVNITTEVTFEERPITFGTTHFVHLLNGEDKKIECEAYRSKSQSLKWFDNKGELHKEFIEITKASVSNDGNYTCHVSDKQGHTETHTYIVNVGFPPKLLADNPLDDWRGEVQDIRSNCDSDAKPQAQVQWKYNGNVIPDSDVKNLGVTYKWGHYTCNVSNPHGSVLKDFDVKSSVCLIPKNLNIAKYMPVAVTENENWSIWKKTSTYFEVVEPNEIIALSCPNRTDVPNYFKKFPTKTVIQAKCSKEDVFVVDAGMYKLSDLQCIQKTYLANKSERPWWSLPVVWSVCLFPFILFVLLFVAIKLKQAPNTYYPNQ